MKVLLLILLGILLSCSTTERSKSVDEVKADFIQKTQILEKQCSAGDDFRCGQYIRTYSVLYGPGLAINLAKSNCEKSQPYFCYAEAYLKYFNGDISQAKIQHQELCQKGHSYSCFFLSLKQLASESTLLKFTSNPYLEEACRLGDHIACLYIKVYLRGKEEEFILKTYDEFIKTHRTDKDIIYILHAMPSIHNKHPKLALSYLRGLCKDGNQDSCFFEKVFQTEKSDRESLSQEYCKQASGLACLTNCEIQLNKMNKDSNFDSCHQGCLLGNDQSCLYSGSIEPDNRQFDKRIFYSKLSCTYGQVKGCHLLAHYLERSGKKDEAIKYLQVACDWGETSSCNDLRKLNKQ